MSENDAAGGCGEKEKEEGPEELKDWVEKEGQVDRRPVQILPPKNAANGKAMEDIRHGRGAKRLKRIKKATSVTAC